MKIETIEKLDGKVIMVDATIDKDYWNNPIKFTDTNHVEYN